MNLIFVWDSRSCGQTPSFYYDPANVAYRCIREKIDAISILVGFWNGDGTLHYYDNSCTRNINNSCINRLRKWVLEVKTLNREQCGKKLKILGTILNKFDSNFYNDLSTADDAELNRMADEVARCVRDIGFDGINEDTEPNPAGPDVSSKLISLWNKIRSKLIVERKMTTADVANYISSVSENANIHYLIPMCYGGTWSEPDFKASVRNHLIISKSPVIIGLGSYDNPPSACGTTYSVSSISLQRQFGLIDTVLNDLDYQYKRKLKGFALFEYGGLSENEWDVWKNWPTKDRYYSQNPCCPCIGSYDDYIRQLSSE